MVHFFRQIVRLSLLFFVSASILSCGSSDSRLVGGPCTFDSMQGTAKFTALNTVPGGVEAYFDFTPDDPKALPRFTNDKNRMLYLGSRLPSSGELSSNGITVGAIFPAIREEITSGTCAPWEYTFPTLSEFYGY